MRAGRAVVLMVLGAVTVAGWAEDAGARVRQLADRFVDEQVQYDPTLLELAGLQGTEHGRFADRRPSAIRAMEAEEQRDLTELLAVPEGGLAGGDRATYATLREQLEADLGMRVCRVELWDVNHFDGWPTNFAEVADRQPVGTAEERRQALERWGSVGRYVDVEIANLREGLKTGYAAPKSVTRRAVTQISTMVDGPVEESPFFSPAKRSEDAGFRASYRQVLVDTVNPALRRYREFLVQEYLPKAREGVALRELPNGVACYRAFLRENTTLQRSPEEVYALGEKTVAEHMAEVERIGEERYGSRDPQVILAAVKAKPSEHFGSGEELLKFSQGFVARSIAVTAAKVVERMPRQEVVVRPLPAYEEAAGGNSQFVLEPDVRKPSVFLLQMGKWKEETRAEAEITAVHETMPGHALQGAVAQEQVQQPTRLSRMADNSAYAEGWARYAEQLGEEEGIYDTEDAAIVRRMWPARGMVVDPGLHVMGWSREKAVLYMMASGRMTRTEAEDTVDRIAVMPGQLTAYDTGGLTILALRAEAKERMGARFSLKAFDEAVLEEGSVPLPELQRHVRAWMAGK